MSDDASSSSGEIHIRSAVPTFWVPDVGMTARWYSEHLGFKIACAFPDREPFAYASLMRGGAEIMLLSLAGYKKPDLSALRPEGLWDAYFRMRGVHAMYQSVQGQPYIKTALTNQFYGDWE